MPNDVCISITSGNPVKTKNMLLVMSSGGVRFQKNSNYIVNSGLIDETIVRLDNRLDDSDFERIIQI